MSMIAAEIEWVILELMGHRTVAGRLTVQVVAGESFLQIEIPGGNGWDGEDAVQLYRPAAVYCITPVGEKEARRAAAAGRGLGLPQIQALEPWDGFEEDGS